MNGVLIATGLSQNKNIGDYIQSVAQEQYWDKVHCYVEREELDRYDKSERINLIMNGWFMMKPDHFPPSPSINPLYVSFHIVPRIEKAIMRPDVIDHLKKYEPIGARDLGTQRMLEKYGIKSYYSSCLTLTLNKQYLSKEKDDKIYFVDPYYEFGGKHKNGYMKLLVSFLYYLSNLAKIECFASNFKVENEHRLLKRFPSLQKRLMAACFYHEYSKFFSDDILKNAEYVLHKVKQSDFANDDEKMDYAKELINKYARAALVVTSRIHCALPCLGVETPVIFVTSDNLNGGGLRSGGRFEGIIDLFHLAKWTANGVIPLSDSLKLFTSKNRFQKKDIVKNKPDYIKYRDDLISRTENFVKQCNNAK